VIKDIFNGITGNQKFDNYINPQGTIFILVVVYIFNIMLLSFLVAMFINRYSTNWNNLDAIRRMNIIRLKNSSSYNEIYGGITITFFPINIFLLPFMLPLIFFKSERLNDFILKLEYAFMILIYCFLGLIVSIPILPLLYFKSVMNQVFIVMNNKRQAYPGQDWVNLIICIVLNPLYIIISMLIDLIGLPSLLLKDSRAFEFKY
jgi:hypothetical protein